VKTHGGRHQTSVSWIVSDSAQWITAFGTSTSEDYLARGE